MIETNFNNEALLNRICEVYGFTQKIQLANHFKIAASSLQNRYTRGNMSYDFAVHCALETGVSLKWLMTGEGEKNLSANESQHSAELPFFELSEGELTNIGIISFDQQIFTKQPKKGAAVKNDNSTYVIEQESSLSDGLWLVGIESALSLREITVLPGKKLHVAGGKVPFECGIDDIKMIGRVVGVYSEVN
ncbi:TPA: phage repressor protein CI [Enterobacter hormaechei]|nr:phage repressor protein CI [Enterobacter hormaechei]HBL8874459.1 phage repressor protein CI [Enterobacter hormaechei]HBL8901453.1 phage repressor protein CI [Enterobacter hormaechei]HBL8914945.1 phage repressor protein CI [Enterobacter hormaechei]HBL8942832.1 phage repressor protein CI [Enterobacter hormaechei]